MLYHQYDRVPDWGGTLFVTRDQFGSGSSIMPAVEWCEEHFGPSLPRDAGCDPHYGPHEVPEGRAWGINSLNDIWIRNADDAFAFKMRWC